VSHARIYRLDSADSQDNVVRYLLTLPLNFIPVVGTAFFLGYNGEYRLLDTRSKLMNRTQGWTWLPRTILPA